MMTHEDSTAHCLAQVRNLVVIINFMSLITHI